MNDKVQQQIEQLSKFAEPIQKFLLENYHPHSAVIITLDDIKVVETSLGIPQSCGYQQENTDPALQIQGRQESKLIPENIIVETVSQAIHDIVAKERDKEVEKLRERSCELLIEENE